MNAMQRQKLRKQGKKAGYRPAGNSDNDKNDMVTPMDTLNTTTPVTPLYIDRELRGPSTIEAKKRP